MCMQAHGSQHGTYCHPCQLAIRNVMQATLYQSHTQLLLVKVVNLLITVIIPKVTSITKLVKKNPRTTQARIIQNVNSKTISWKRTFSNNLHACRKTHTIKHDAEGKTANNLKLYILVRMTDKLLPFPPSQLEGVCRPYQTLSGWSHRFAPKPRDTLVPHSAKNVA